MFNLLQYHSPASVPMQAPCWCAGIKMKSMLHCLLSSHMQNHHLLKCKKNTFSDKVLKSTHQLICQHIVGHHLECLSIPPCPLGFLQDHTHLWVLRQLSIIDPISPNLGLCVQSICIPDHIWRRQSLASNCSCSLLSPIIVAMLYSECLTLCAQLCVLLKRSGSN